MHTAKTDNFKQYLPKNYRNSRFKKFGLIDPSKNTDIPEPVLIQ